MVAPSSTINMKIERGEEFRQELLPALPGFAVTLKAPRTAIEAGEDEFQTFPVLGWVVYWYTSEDDYGHPMVTEPLFAYPAVSGEWNTDYDFGCAASPTSLNHGRQYRDRYEWRLTNV